MLLLEAADNSDLLYKKILQPESVCYLVHGLVPYIILRA